MRDEEHGPLEIGQGRHQHLFRRHVEVVGRFVEHQQVGRIEQHLGHDQARLFATGQHAARLFDVVAGEAEAAGQGT